MTQSIPQSLLIEASKNKVIPIVGTGVSMSLRNHEGDKLFLNWPGLLEAAAEKLKAEGKEDESNGITAMLALNKYKTAADLAREGLTGRLWNEFFKEKFDIPFNQVNPNTLDLPKEVWKISNLIITLNYDRVLKWACPHQNDFIKIDNTNTSMLAEIQREQTKPTVWHLHGDIDNPNSIVFTTESYNTLYIESNTIFKAALNTLASLATSHSLLFIGCGLDDIELLAHLDEQFHVYKGNSGPHYALVHKNDKEIMEQKLSDNATLVLISYEDFGKPLLETIRTITKQKPEETTVKEPIRNKTESQFSLDNKPFFLKMSPKRDALIGRKQSLNTLRSSLMEDASCSIGQVASFQAIGGIGKTQLVVDYAYKYRDEYSGGVIFLEADQDMDSQLIKLAEDSKWAPASTESNDKKEIALHQLKTRNEILLILDNVESLEDIKKYLPDSDNNGHIIITSRNNIPGFPNVEIKLLDESESCELILKNARMRYPLDSNEIKAINKIIEYLAGLPLALELAGSYIENRALSLSDYLLIFENNMEKALPANTSHLNTTHHSGNIFNTLNISEKGFENKEVLDLLTISGNAPMSKELITALLDCDPVDIIEPLSLGTKLKLLEKDNNDNFRIHRLLKDVRQGNKTRDLKPFFVNILPRINKWTYTNRVDYLERQKLVKNSEHLSTWLNYTQKHSLRNRFIRFALAIISVENQKFESAKKYLLQLLEELETLEIKDELLSSVYVELGGFFDIKGEFLTSVFYCKKGLKLRKGLFGRYSEHTGEVYNNLSHAYVKSGNPNHIKKALIYQKIALKIQKKLFGDNHADTATSYNNLGSLLELYGDQEDVSKGLEYKKKSLEISKQLLGDNHPDTATSYNNVGHTLERMGDPESLLKGFNYKVKALEIRINILGENHPHTANSFNNVGLSLLENKDPQKIQKGFMYLQKALKISKLLFGENHPDTATSYDNLGGFLIETESPDQIRRGFSYHEKALKIRKFLFGENHPDTLTSYNNLGIALLETGNELDTVRGFEYKEKALNICLSLFGENHPDTIKSYYSLGISYFSNNQFKKGIYFHLKALAIVTIYNINTDYSFNFLFSLKDHEVPNWKESLFNAYEELPDDHKDHIDIYKITGEIPQINRALKGISSSLGLNNPKKQQSRNSLCECGSGKKYKRCCGKN